jgi:DNA-directed RNA polymerase sigma subunit (sigma70/sigma32)
MSKVDDSVAHCHTTVKLIGRMRTKFTKRERTVLALILAEHTVEEIAKALESPTRERIRQIYAKVGRKVFGS